MTNNKYLFRGFHKEENGKETIYLNGEEIKGSWVYGNLVYIRCENKYYIVSYDTNIYDENIFGDIKEIDITEVITETVSQYTCLDDKNGKKIFENDIVENTLVLDNNTLNTNEDIVEFNKEDCSFMLGKGKRHFNKNLDLEVIETKFDEKEAK